MILKVYFLKFVPYASYSNRCFVPEQNAKVISSDQWLSLSTWTFPSLSHMFHSSFICKLSFNLSHLRATQIDTLFAEAQVSVSADQWASLSTSTRVPRPSSLIESKRRKRRNAKLKRAAGVTYEVISSTAGSQWTGWRVQTRVVRGYNPGRSLRWLAQ